MKKFAKILIFILAFQLEVRVRASTETLQEPEACLQGKSACAVQVLKSGFHLTNNSQSFHATPGATVMRLSAAQWRLIKGTVWVEKGALEVQTAYADMKASHGQYWVIDQEDRVIVRNMDANLAVTLRDGKVVQVPEGFEFWVAGVDSQGKTDYGMIRPIEMKEHLPLWNSLYVGTKENFKKEVERYKITWGDLAAKSAAIYKEIINRKIAAEEASEQAQALRAKQKADEARRVRQMYWQRSFER